MTTQWFRRWRPCSLALLAMLALGVPTAQAGLITLDFAGEINGSTMPGISVGDILLFRLAYEDTTSDANPGNPVLGQYDSGVSLMEVYVNGVLYDTMDLSRELSVRDGQAGVDKWFSQGRSSGLDNRAWIDLADNTETAHADDSLVFPVLGNYTGGAVAIADNASSNSASGDIDSITVQFRKRGDRLGDLVDLIISSELFHAK